MVLQKKIRIGELLVANQKITDDQLQTALTEQKKSGVRLGAAIIKLGYMTEDEFLNFLSQQLQVPLVDLRHRTFDPKLIKVLPETYARRYSALVIEQGKNGLLIGMTDPTDITAIDEITRVVQAPCEFALVRESDMKRTLDLVYRRTAEITTYAQALYKEVGGEEAILSAGSEQENAPVVRLVDAIFEDAVQVSASDVHIEPDSDCLRIRQRVDGLLIEQIMKAKSIAAAITLRLKLMAGLNISEKRLPQDGRFRIKIRGKDIDVRMSTLPTQFGESVVMRLLDQSSGILSLDAIGMPEDILKKFRKMIHLPRGMVLVTGPTGSGKTTTLYGALSEINFPDSKIITVEDPVEYYLPRVNQVQVNPKVDLTFARVLRTAMRQDPDIILVGEMRDEETAEIGMRASLTGHLVLSTLHANDAVSSAIRLLDLGAKGYLIASTLRCVLAQRLVRRICQSCRATATPTDEETLFMNEMKKTKKIDFSEGIFYGKGCSQCNNTGFRGRIGIYELLILNAAMMQALDREDPAEFTKLAQEDIGDGLLLDSGLKLVVAGMTTLEEVIRVAGDI